MRKILALSLSLLLTVGQASAVTSTFFKDTGTHFSEAYVLALHEKCGINGFQDANGNLLHEFRPDLPITRAELLQMVMRCVPVTEELPSSKVFADVKADSWYGEAVTTSEARGWVDGYPDGNFRPLALVNRAEALKIIHKSTGMQPQQPTYTLPFRDVPVDAWFTPYVFYGYAEGFIRGRDVVTFAPAAFLTRGEAAKLIALYHKFVAPPQDPTNNANTNGSTSNTNQNAPVSTAAGTTFMGCPVFPADNPWNQDISKASVHPNSQNYIDSILAGRKNLHPDFGSNPDYGIPYVVVDNSTPKTEVTAEYADETDAGPYPIPANPPIEAGGDRHILMFHKDECKLYELFAAYKEGANWLVGSGAIFDLRSNALRPDYWTSADAAGLPIFPGLVRYDEVKSGKITHALRFTVSKTQRAFIHPATHYASSSTDVNRPPMGLRLRLKADFDLSNYSGDSKVILEALKTYGMIVADNGSDWYISGATDTRWNDDDLSQIKGVPGSAFEVVYTGELIK